MEPAMTFKILSPLALIASLITMHHALYAITAREIIDRAENSMRGASSAGSYEITIKTRRWERTLAMMSWDHRASRRSFTEITAPGKDAGNRFLLIKRTMRQYVPKLQKDIRISPSMMMQSWMGSDFTNDDSVEQSSLIDDYIQRIAGSKMIDCADCNELEQLPRPGADVVWGKIMYYARKTDCLPAREEFYNERGVIKKVMTFSSYRTMHDRVIPTLMKMQSAGKDDRYTIMEIKNIRYNVAMPEHIFSLQHLKRR